MSSQTDSKYALSSSSSNSSQSTPSLAVIVPSADIETSYLGRACTVLVPECDAPRVGTERERQGRRRGRVESAGRGPDEGQEEEGARVERETGLGLGRQGVRREEGGKGARPGHCNGVHSAQRTTRRWRVGTQSKSSVQGRCPRASEKETEGRAEERWGRRVSGAELANQERPGIAGPCEYELVQKRGQESCATHLQPFTAAMRAQRSKTAAAAGVERWDVC
ncbi:hypothetical protein B0H14DRAFT_2588336 [Mycena olivaceomarginata]|nr:hypothetical protein B0H14DRAFT_2588336 [Mycena olivaceomarginata]